jgi:hypothetical protein
MCFAPASRSKLSASPSAATLRNKAEIQEQHSRASLRNIGTEESAVYGAVHGRTDATRVDQTGRQKAAMVWAHGANPLISRPRVSPAGDAYDLAAS